MLQRGAAQLDGVPRSLTPARQAWQAACRHAAADALQQRDATLWHSVRIWRVEKRRAKVWQVAGSNLAATHHRMPPTAKWVCTLNSAGQVQAPCRHRQAAAKPQWDALRGGSVRHLSNVQALLLRLLVHSQPAGLHSSLCNTSSRGWVGGWWVGASALPSPRAQPRPSTLAAGKQTAWKQMHQAPLALRRVQKSRKERAPVQAAMHSRPSSCMPSWRPEPP